MFTTRSLVVYVLVAALTLSACGGGGGSAALVPSGGATPASGSSTLAPASESTTMPIPADTSAPMAIALSAIAGVTSDLTLPITYADPGTTLAITEGTMPPSNGPVLQNAVRYGQDASNPLGVTGLVYIGLVPSGEIDLGPLGLTISLPSSLSIDPGDQFYLALYDGSAPSAGYQADWAGPVSADNGTVTFGSDSGVPPFTLHQLIQYIFALYRVAHGHTPPPKPTPPPTPTPHPTGPPHGTITLTPSSISFLGTGLTQAFTIGETAYGGPFTAVSGSTNVVTVGKQDVLGTAWTATSVNAGTTSITISDARGNTATLPVTVTVTIVPIQ